MEIWKDIIGYEGLYQISNTGFVKSFDRYIHGISILGKKFVIKRSGALMSIAFDKNKYRVISLFENRKKKMFKVHRLVAIHFIPNPLNLPQVNHKDGDKSNNNDWNLEWNTCPENLKHASENNLTAKGIRHNKAKLTEEDVYFIRKLREEHNTPTHRLIEMFRVNQSTIDNVIKRRGWKHI